MADKNRIRLRVDPALHGGDLSFPVVNFFTGRLPVLPRGKDAQIELVILDNGILDQNVANVSSIVCEIKTLNSPSSAPLISVPVVPPAMNATLTAADDAAAANQHAIIILPAAQTGLDMTGADASNNKSFNIIITATRNGNLSTIAFGTIICHSDGGQYSGNTPTASDPTYYNKNQIDGMQSQTLKLDNANGVAFVLRNNVGGKLKIWLDDTGTFRTDYSTGP